MDYSDSMPDPRRPRQPRWLRPQGVMPVGLPLGHFLVRSPQLVVFADGLRVFPAGFEFTVHVRRDRRPDGPGRGDALDWMPPIAQDRGSADQLRLGVLFPDGRRAVAHEGWSVERRTPDGPQPPVISAEDGGGSEDHWDQGFWVWGLPEEGPVTIVHSWPAEGLTESRFELDGDALRAAAAETVVFWPEPADE
ncbi:hypothetical protein [Kitasatospora sp. LaBMicrA B282]|uniref:hypothetical protein n=1 Tax=Kitasatospora sp. LaBMicrA B282 TaxID=3420949 RepID=UPI003D0C774B